MLDVPISCSLDRKWTAPDGTEYEWQRQPNRFEVSGPSPVRRIFVEVELNSYSLLDNPWGRAPTASRPQLVNIQTRQVVARSRTGSKLEEDNTSLAVREEVENVLDGIVLGFVILERKVQRGRRKEVSRSTFPGTGAIQG